MRRRMSPLAVLVFIAADSARAANEWPCFHGPRRDNKSTDTGLLQHWPESGPRLLWTAAGLGKGYSSAVIAGGRIFTAGVMDEQTRVIALDLDGKPQWEAPNGHAWQTTMSHAVGYNGSRSTPTYDEGRVYHLNESGRLVALDAQSGKELWHLDLLKQFDAKVPKYGLAESVLIEGDRLLCCPGGAKGFLVCLDKATGKTLWTTTDIPGTQAYSSLVLGDFAGSRQVLGMSAAVVFGADLATGRLLWSAEHGNERENSATDPIFHSGYVFASTGYGKGSLVVQLAPAGNGVAAKTLWASKLLDNHHGGVVLVDGYLYGAGHQAEGWFCLDFMTGKPMWKASGKGSLTYAEGRLFCLDERGRMTLVEATPEKFRSLGAFTLPKGGTGLYWAHPVVCGGRLYVRHADCLFAYDIRAQ